MLACFQRIIDSWQTPRPLTTCATLRQQRARAYTKLHAARNEVAHFSQSIIDHLVPNNILKWSRDVSQTSATPPWPVEVRLAKDRRTLNVVFDDGASFELSAELLRVMSPSAEVQGHSESERKTVGGKRSVRILSVDPVGNYAVRLGFDDMHNTGIFSWAFLREIGGSAEQRFQSYLDDLAAKGLDRDAPGVR